MIGFKAQSLWGRVQIKLIKLIKFNQMQVFEARENRSTRAKISQSREENQQTQPTYDTEVVGRRVLSSLRHHCSPAAKLENEIGG